MILDREIYLVGNSKNIAYYSGLGYSVKVNERFLVRVEHLSKASTAKVRCECDFCGAVREVQWGSLIKYLGGDTGSKYHCSKCSSIKRRETNKARYGGNSPTSSPAVVEKTKRTNLERYGTECTLHAEEISKAVKKTWMDRYGADSPLKNEGVKKRIRETNLERYGAEVPLKSQEVYDRMVKTNTDRYGVENVFEAGEVKQKIAKGMIDKWGMPYTQTDDFKEKSRKANLEKYGAENFTNSTDYLKMLLDRKKYKYENMVFLEYSRKERKYSIHCRDCGQDFLINSDMMAARANSGARICLNCNPIGDKYKSSGEENISIFLEEKNIRLRRTDMRLISPHHLDIVLEDIGVAIEFNGIYWHSDKFKEKRYHIDKYEKCEALGIRLLQIWEDDWNNRKEIVKSMLLNKIGMGGERVYARKCQVREVGTAEKDLFLEGNHIQGKAASSINLGLYHRDELVSLMTFGKRKTNGKSEFELIRFCNRINTTVAGGASKLFGHFKKTREFDRVVSYSDNSYSDGGLYGKLGFEYAGTSINYYWCDGKNKYHRFNFNKKRLVGQGFDPGKTEDRIMRERGFTKIWGAGNKKWVWRADMPLQNHKDKP